MKLTNEDRDRIKAKIDSEAVNNKYYEPSIEEFFVGFKYEKHHGYYWNLEGLEEDEMYWEKKVFGMVLSEEGELKTSYVDKAFYQLLKLAANEKVFNAHHGQPNGGHQFRVKYLDREDIENLGFIHQGAGWYKYPRPSGELGYWTMVSLRTWHDHELTIRGHRGNDLDSTEQEILFQGVVKNTSELEQLLLRLNIVNNED